MVSFAGEAGCFPTVYWGELTTEVLKHARTARGFPQKHFGSTRMGETYECALSWGYPVLRKPNRNQPFMDPIKTTTCFMFVFSPPQHGLQCDHDQHDALHFVRRCEASFL